MNIINLSNQDWILPDLVYKKKMENYIELSSYLVLGREIKSTYNKNLLNQMKWKKGTKLKWCDEFLSCGEELYLFFVSSIQQELFLLESFFGKSLFII